MIDIKAICEKYGDTIIVNCKGKVESFRGFIKPSHCNSPDHYLYQMANYLNDTILAYPTDFHIDKESIIEFKKHKYCIGDSGTYRTKDKVKTPLFNWARMREIV